MKRIEIRKKPVSITCMIFCFIYLFNTDLLYSEIKKRVLEDGTVEYYNSAGKKSKLKPFKKRNFKSPYNNLIESMSRKEDLDPYLVKCVIKIESDFNPDAVSVAGAMGLMQIMQEIAYHYNVRDPFDPEENLSAGIKHLKYLFDYFEKDIPLALAAYHAGLGRVKKNMQIPPIESTIQYVNDIMLLYNGECETAGEKVKGLYKRINSEGIIEIYDK